jgi:predicted ribosomally synthesized peptide with nif11-like leader
MSVESINQFFQKLSEDEKLQQELAKAVESAENEGVATAELGAKHGYQFTSDELWQEIQNRHNEIQRSKEAGELNDEELEAVAGGFFKGGSKDAWIGFAGAVGGGFLGLLGGIAGGILSRDKK